MASRIVCNGVRNKPVQAGARVGAFAPTGPACWLGSINLLLLALLALPLTGCVRMPASQPKAQVKSLQTKDTDSGSITPTALQASVMRFADEYSMVVAQAAEDFANKLNTTEARRVAARIKLGQATAAVVDAVGQNPAVNALDLVVLATVSRMMAEEYLVEQFGEAALPLVEAGRRLETNAWSLVKRVLKPEQQQELRELIQQWRRANPTQRYVGAVRFREFAEAIGKETQALNKPTSVFSLLFLDPMAGLDPTVRAVEETRYLAERGLYYAQRLPILLSWQAEFLALQLADQPAARQVLTNADQLAGSLQIFARTADQLPQLLSHEREAAIQQVFVGVATERSNLLASLASEEKKMRALLAESRETFSAASSMATSAQGAIQSLDEFVRYVSPRNTNSVPDPAKTNRRPFNVLDYGTAAGQIDGMAKTLNTLLNTVNQSVPEVKNLGQEATANAQDVVRQAFLFGLLLILILLGGSVLAGLTYRILVNRFAREPERRSLSPKS
ncbi:MAG TPA: hypothetical protein VNU68_12165 [Verrucomicrobiae bacterium]|nr:hypothetical protein [Verrucomicrobiae bacterium]